MPYDKNEQIRWLIASHNMIGEKIENLLKKRNLHPKTELLFSSYVDLLKRKNIMQDKELKKLCEDVWAKHEQALEILIAHKKAKYRLYMR